MNKTAMIVLGVIGTVVAASWYLLRPPTESQLNAAAEKSTASGILALQLHAGLPMMVQFKDIELKKLK